MVAYNFKRQFVEPICLGLGIAVPDGFAQPISPRAKLQTIRGNGKRRHARSGETVQLYYGMRTRQCLKIGEARCAGLGEIIINLTPGTFVIEVDGKQLAGSEHDEFARSDGFKDAQEMARFWSDEHGKILRDWSGVIIRWEPLT